MGRFNCNLFFKETIMEDLLKKYGETIIEVLRQLQERNGQQFSQYQDKVRSREMDANIRGRGGSGLNVVKRMWNGFV